MAAYSSAREMAGTMSVSRSTARMARVERGRGMRSTTQVWGGVAVSLTKKGRISGILLVKV